MAAGNTTALFSILSEILIFGNRKFRLFIKSKGTDCLSPEGESVPLLFSGGVYSSPSLSSFSSSSSWAISSIIPLISSSPSPVTAEKGIMVIWSA